MVAVTTPLVESFIPMLPLRVLGVEGFLSEL